jgi:hypothetical protein
LNLDGTRSSLVARRRFFSLGFIDDRRALYPSPMLLPDARIAKRSRTFSTTRRSPMLNVRSFLDSSRSGRKTIRGNDSRVSAGYQSPTQGRIPAEVSRVSTSRVMARGVDESL